MTMRTIGLCAVSGHESRDLHGDICARHWAQITRTRHQRRRWHQQLAHWWRRSWLTLLCAVLAGLFLGLCVAVPLWVALKRFGVI